MVEETINRFDIYLVKLNPTVGSEIQKTRPCIVISPNEMNVLNTVIVAPMTSKGFDFIFRPKINFDGKKSGSSAILTNMLESPALLIQKENSQDIKSGDLVDILLLNQIK